MKGRGSQQKGSKTTKGPCTLPEAFIRELFQFGKDDAFWDDSSVDEGNLPSTVLRVHEVLRCIDAELQGAAGGEEVTVFPNIVAAKTTTADERLQNLSAWLADSCQADVTSYKFAASLENSSRGNGVVAQRDIAKDEIFMEIPRKALFSAKFGLAMVPALTPLLAQLEDNPVLELAVLVAYHKVNETASFFAPYLAVLPDEYALPLYWDADLYGILHGTPTAERAAKSLRAAITLYCRSLTMLHRIPVPSLPPQRFTWNVFRWALAVVLTRQNNVPCPVAEVPGSFKEVQALIPGWDMMNHEPGEMTTGFDVGLDVLTYPAMRAFPVGSEVSMCYGMRQNELFVNYSGFCVPDSPFDWFELPMQLQQDGILKIREGLVRAATSAPGPDQGAVALEGAGLVMVPVRRDQAGLLHPLAWYCAVASAVDKAEAAAVMRSRFTSYDDLLAAGLLSEATVERVHETLRGALRDYLRPLEVSLAAMAGAALQPSGQGIEGRKMLPGVRAATIDACKNLMCGHIDMIQKALEKLRAPPS